MLCFLQYEYKTRQPIFHWTLLPLCSCPAWAPRNSHGRPHRRRIRWRHPQTPKAPTPSPSPSPPKPQVPSAESVATKIALEHLKNEAKLLLKEIQDYDDHMQQAEEEHEELLDMEQKVVEHIAKQPRKLLHKSFNRWKCFTARAKSFSDALRSKNNKAGRLSLPNVFGEVSFATPARYEPNMAEVCFYFILYLTNPHLQLFRHWNKRRSSYYH